MQAREIGAAHGVALPRPADAKGKIALTITFLMPDKRRRDLDGCLSSIKHTLDGVAGAIGVDDSLFEPITLHRGLCPEGAGRVMMTFEYGE